MGGFARSHYGNGVDHDPFAGKTTWEREPEPRPLVPFDSAASTYRPSPPTSPTPPEVTGTQRILGAIGAAVLSGAAVLTLIGWAENSAAAKAAKKVP